MGEGGGGSPRSSPTTEWVRLNLHKRGDITVLCYVDHHDAARTTPRNLYVGLMAVPLGGDVRVPVAELEGVVRGVV